MRKKSKKSLIAGRMTMAAIFILLIVFLVIFRMDMRKMTPLESGHVVDQVVAVQDGYVNMYLIQDGDRYIAIDAGNSAVRIERELQKLSIDPDQVMAVFLTHTDFDHVAALTLFTNAEIYLSIREKQMINGQTSRFLFRRNHIAREELTLLEDGQIIHLGNTEIHSVSVPGHTPGSMCYRINHKYLFTGDALSLKQGQIATFNQLFNMNSRTASESMKTITQLPGVAYLFTGHHGYSVNFLHAVSNWDQ